MHFLSTTNMSSFFFFLQKNHSIKKRNASIEKSYVNISNFPSATSNTSLNVKHGSFLLFFEFQRVRAYERSSKEFPSFSEKTTTRTIYSNIYPPRALCLTMHTLRRDEGVSSVDLFPQLFALHRRARTSTAQNEITSLSGILLSEVTEQNGIPWVMDDLNFAMITGGSGICMKIAQTWFSRYPVPSSSSHPLFFSAPVLLSFAHGPYIF